MEDRDSKGVFLCTMKIDSELMVMCLLAILNHLPDIKFTAVFADEASLGYRVNFSSPEEETVLALPQLMVRGRSILITPKKIFISRNSTMSDESEINKLSEKFGKEEIIKEGYYNPRNNQMIEPEYKNKAGTSGENRPNVSHHNEEIYLESDDDDDSVDTAEIPKAGFSNAGPPPSAVSSNSSSKRHETQNRCSEDMNVLSEPLQECNNTAVSNTAGFSNAGPPPSAVSSNSSSKRHETQNRCSEDMNVLSEPLQECNNTALSNTAGFSNAGPPQSSGSSNSNRKKREMQKSAADMNVLSEPFQQGIDRVLSEINIITWEQLQILFKHIKKKSNLKEMVEIAERFITKEPKIESLKKLLQRICDLYYDTSQSTTEDKRFIRWLKGRIDKFNFEAPPPKRKRETS